MKDKPTNKSFLFIFIAIAVVITTGTFAWLSWRTQNTAMSFVVGDVKGLQVSLVPYQINATLSPVSSYTDGTVINVTAANAKTESDKFTLFYNIDTIDSALIDSGFKYTITKCTSNCDTASNYQVLTNASGDFSQTASNSELTIYQETVPAGATYKYRVYLWIDSASGNQSSMQNKTFTGELMASIAELNYVPSLPTWSFEDVNELSDWTEIDADGDGYNWSIFHYQTGVLLRLKP